MNILSFDIEEPWHVIPANPGYKSSCFSFDMVQFFDRLACILDDVAVTPIFFWVGTVAEQNKRLIRQLSENGHLIGSHSYDHEDYAQFSGSKLRAQLARSKNHIEDILGHEVHSFRAPGFSVGDIREFLAALEHVGFSYDFSICDAQRINGGTHNSGIRLPTRIPDLNLFEFPMSYSAILGRKLYVTGGGYFRIFPTPMISHIERRNSYNMYYLHPIDFMRPQFKQSDPRSFQSRFRQSINTYGSEAKLKRLLQSRRWHTGTEKEWTDFYV